VRAALLVFALAGCDATFGLIHIPDRTDAGIDALDAAACSTQPFTNARDYATGTLPLGIAVADVDGDSKLDIVTANQTGNTVTVLLGLGDGTFAPKQDFDTPMGPTGLAIGDFDDNGTQDVAVAELGGNLMSVFPGTGGAFAARYDYPIASATDVALLPGVTAGRPNLAAVGANKLTVMVNNGTGLFSPNGYVDIGDAANDVHIDDFDGDRKPDFVTANIVGSNISIGIANETGGFAATNIPMPMGPRVAVTGKIDGDERPDIAVVSAEAGMVSLLLNTDGSHFVPGMSTPVSGSPIGLAIGDLDVDGDNDLAVTNSNESKVTLLMNDGNGNFTQNGVALAAGVTPGELVIADFDRDARNDIAVVNRTSGNVRVYLGCPH